VTAPAAGGVRRKSRDEGDTADTRALLQELLHGALEGPTARPEPAPPPREDVDDLRRLHRLARPSDVERNRRVLTDELAGGIERQDNARAPRRFDELPAPLGQRALRAEDLREGALDRRFVARRVAAQGVAAFGAHGVGAPAPRRKRSGTDSRPPRSTPRIHRSPGGIRRQISSGIRQAPLAFERRSPAAGKPLEAKASSIHAGDRGVEQASDRWRGIRTTRGLRSRWRRSAQSFEQPGRAGARWRRRKSRSAS
jgi:hypothetical protein